MHDFSYLGTLSVASVEQLFKQYQEDPDSVDESWRQFFRGFTFAQTHFPKLPESESPQKGENSTGRRGGSDRHTDKEFKVLNLINNYRTRGHLFTKTNPVRERRKYSPTLDPINFGLDDRDLETVFEAGQEVGLGPSRLDAIIAHLSETYCHSIGAEYQFIRSPSKVVWLREQMEPCRNKSQFTLPQKKRILKKLNEACLFEQFIHTKFVGQKRFSLEGAESMIPALDAIVTIGARHGIKEFSIGMAHRGRLNVLANLMQKPFDEIFSEFEGFTDLNEAEKFMGDVKYHQGYSSDIVTDNGDRVHLALCANPSHLEAVSPLVAGVVRAKIETRYGGDADKIAPILIHGDAAIAGQGVVYELLQMSRLPGYTTGGTIHLVINNQIGFTTNYLDARSSTYCTDVAKVTLSPVFHVNGDDVEAVIHAIGIAVEYRQRYNTDVFIDLLCYRRYGHNEGDEPKYTQPLLYKKIARHPNPWQIYQKKLDQEGSIPEKDAKKQAAEFKNMLDGLLTDIRKSKRVTRISTLQSQWKQFKIAEEHDFDESPNTQVDEQILKSVGESISKVPDAIKVISKVTKLLGDRHRMIFETDAIDWSTAESLAFGSLLNEGTAIRFTGQDVERGTFSQRHAVIKREDSEDRYIPVNHIRPDQATLEIYNSTLSEYAVLGFEFGFAMANPQHLVMWEAQFGDFANGAQIVIDQFICCSTTKWKRMNGLVVLLPHGYEGQGPEHSSARLERYLQLCAHYNMTVANVSTPANYFHILRRQLKRPFRIPLILMTPKSLLRHPKCVSPLTSFSSGSFQEVIDDDIVKPRSVTKIILCGGKIYYDLLAKREECQRMDVALIRIEQLYPTPIERLQKVLKRYGNCKQWLWVQEEPENMGAWTHISRELAHIPLEVVSRKPSESTATGFAVQHAMQQNYILNKSFDITPQPKKLKT